jgi:precorrin-6x reductase
VLRPERAYPPRLTHPLVHYADSYEEVVAHLQTADYEPVLALSGVQTIVRLRAYWQQRRMLFRVLPRESSVALAREAGFPTEHLLLALPGADLAEEVRLIRRTGAQAVVTKESGESGFLSVKMAARQAGVPIFIVRRPALPAHFRGISGKAELLDFLHTCVHGLTTGS